MRKVAIVIVMIGLAVFVQIEADVRPRVDIEPYGWAGATYLEGKTIGLKVVVTSPDGPSRIAWYEHDHAYSKRLPCPTSVAALVVDERGEILTRSDMLRPDNPWWTWQYLWSTTHEYSPHNTVEIDAGEEVVCIVPLDVVLQGAPRLKGSLGPGRYWVRLSVDGNESNELPIEVRP